MLERPTERSGYRSPIPNGRGAACRVDSAADPSRRPPTAAFAEAGGGREVPNGSVWRYNIPMRQTKPGLGRPPGEKFPRRLPVYDDDEGMALLQEMARQD